MPCVRHHRSGGLLLAGILMLSSGCKKKDAAPQPDHPRLSANVVLRDVTFHSAALNRDMQYRVVFPLRVASGQRLPVVYLLHGGGGGFRDWTNDSDVAHFAESGLILVMPEGASSYYTKCRRPAAGSLRRLHREGSHRGCGKQVSSGNRPCEPRNRRRLHGGLRSGEPRVSSS